MQKVVYISNSRDFTEQNDINNNKYLVRINQLLEDGWVISQMNTQTVEVDPKLENYLHKETLVSVTNTHLDVYKRQAFQRLRRAGPTVWGTVSPWGTLASEGFSPPHPTQFF